MGGTAWAGSQTQYYELDNGQEVHIQNPANVFGGAWYDDTNPIRELWRLYELHRLYFFTSRAEDLIPLTPAVVKQLEPILLREPLRQQEKWLDARQGTANRKFLEALANFMYWENYDVRVRMDGKIDKVVLDDILKRRQQ